MTRFNDMFLEREEDAVIRLRSLEDEGSAAQTASALKDVYRCQAVLCSSCMHVPLCSFWSPCLHNAQAQCAGLCVSRTRMRMSTGVHSTRPDIPCTFYRC